MSWIDRAVASINKDRAKYPLSFEAPTAAQLKSFSLNGQGDIRSWITNHIKRKYNIDLLRTGTRLVPRDEIDTDRKKLPHFMVAQCRRNPTFMEALSYALWHNPNFDREVLGDHSYNEEWPKLLKKISVLIYEQLFKFHRDR